MFQAHLSPVDQLQQLLNRGFTEPSFVQALHPQEDASATKRDADATLEPEAPRFKRVCTVSAELDRLVPRPGLTFEAFTEHLESLTAQRREGQLAVGAMIERLARSAQLFQEKRHEGHELLIQLSPKHSLQLRITREEHCSNCFPKRKKHKAYYIEVAERSSSKPARKFRKLRKLVSMRADDDGRGEWMWINAGKRVHGSQSKRLATILSRCLGLTQVHLADFATVPATGLSGDLRLGLLQQLLYGPQCRGFYGSEGYQLQAPSAELVSRIEICRGEYLAVNPYYEEHDQLIESLRNLQARDIYKTLLEGDSETQAQFKAVFEAQRPQSSRTVVSKSSRRLCELMLACKEAGRRDQLSFLMLRIVEVGIRAEEGTRARAMQEKVAKAWEAGYFDVLYCASFA